MPDISWWPLIASILHSVEEFVVPGGVADWDRKFRPAYAASITTRLHVAVFGLAIAFAVGTSHAQAATPPDRAAAVIETFLRWAIEGKELPADPPKASPALPDRRCGGRFDPEHPPATIYVAWQLSAEAQHAACNWKYDVAGHHASPLTPAEAAEVSERIVAGTIGQEARAFFHSLPQGEERLKVTAGYCWGSASGTFAFRADGPVLTGDLTVHGY